MPYILGIKVDSTSRPEALALVDQMLRHGGQHIITTPNPEMLMDAQNDPEFKDSLNSAALALPDGVGLMLASKFLKKGLQYRIPGSDFVFDLMDLANKKGYKVYLLGGKPGIAQQTKAKLLKRFEDLKIVGVDSGSQSDPLNNTDCLEKIKQSEPDILLVAFGHRIQEKWIAKYLHTLPSVKVAMGVGGVFDFISGRVKRAPRFMCKLGLEWLWRLIIQPWRIKRIWKAVVVFSWCIIKQK